MSPRTAQPTTPAMGPESIKPARRSQRERSSQAEQAMLDAAATLFARRGVDQTSLADICELAGYSRGLANHHFGTKAALVERLAKRTQEAFVADVEGNNGDALDALETLTDNYLSTIQRGTEAGRAFFVMWGAAIPTDATLRSVFATDDAQFRLGVAGVLAAGQKNKTVTTELRPNVGAVMLVGLLRGVAAQYLIDPDAFNMLAARKACRQFVRRSFAPP